MKHYSVLLNEVIDNLNIQEDGIYIDATLGYAGHSKEILKRIKRGFLFAFDNDVEAINYSTSELSTISSNFKIFHCNFSNMKEVLAQEKVTKVDGILFDLGFSSPQVDENERGFSFMQDGPLDMRMNQDSEFRAYDVVNFYSMEELTNIFYQFAQEKKAKAIAKNILRVRAQKPIKTTLELVDVIHQAVGSKYFYKFYPQRKIFQALRIEVNHELEVLENVLPEAINLLKPQGRICVISFHSLEDKIVKMAFNKASQVDERYRGLKDIPQEYQPLVKKITKKPIVPTEDEKGKNSRSSSAKLRVIERI